MQRNTSTTNANNTYNNSKKTIFSTVNSKNKPFFWKIKMDSDTENFSKWKPYKWKTKSSTHKWTSKARKKISKNKIPSSSSNLSCFKSNCIQSLDRKTVIISFMTKNQWSPHTKLRTFYLISMISCINRHREDSKVSSLIRCYKA